MSLDVLQEVQPKTVRLELTVREPEVVAELIKYQPGIERDTFAQSALRIGILALRQASGILDVNAVRTEGDRLLGSVRELLTENTVEFVTNVAATLKTYFDPTEGHLPQRLDRLIRNDGELQAILNQHLHGEESVISRTLVKHIGEESPLLRLLSPEESKGVIATFGKTIEVSLQVQRDHLLRQFSLDDKESALSRLVGELTGANGKLREDLAEDVQKLHEEFSLDNDNGALARLVTRVEKAQRTISDQFSLDNKESAMNHLVGLMEKANSSITDNMTLDNEDSPLFRLRKELTDVIGRMEKTSTEFHQEVKLTLESFKVRRAEAARSTRHGGEFEEAVGDLLQLEAQRTGDILEATGARTGILNYCKVGDHVITMGTESAAPGARIVIESKEDRSYDLAKALEESEQGRKNREAQVALFVFSKATAPAGLEPFGRHGKHIVVVWDREDPNTDIFVRVGLSVARALALKERCSTEKDRANFVAVQTAITAISSDILMLTEISKWGKTVQRSGDKIWKKAEVLLKKLKKNLIVVDTHLAHDPAGIADDKSE